MRRVVSASSITLSRFSAARTMATAVRYHALGDAQKVYQLEELDAAVVKAPLAPNEVALKFIAAAINPSDINIASGTYGKKAPLPAIGGNEGVAVVKSVGAQVKNVKAGDWVVPVDSPFGTWTEFAKAADNKVIKVSNDVPAAYAASVSINPATAYRLLRDFVQLKPGDYIIQNGANSMVGLAVIQMARELGIKTINIIRSDRPNGEQALRLLSNLGGDINIPDSVVPTAGFQDILRELSPIKLGLNCVGGETTTDLARCLGNQGTLVTYGGMSKKHLSIPTDLVTYKQLQLKGFWIADWYDTHSVTERQAMYEEIFTAVKAKKLSFFYEVYDFDDFAYALKKSQEPFKFRKVILNLDHPDRLKEHDAKIAGDYAKFDLPLV